MDDIAIIAVASILPGASGAESLWENLVRGRVSLRDATSAELGEEPAHYLGSRGQPERAYCLRGGFARDAALAEPGACMSRAEWEALACGQRWALHVSHGALRDAGYASNERALGRCGVILGDLSFPTERSVRAFLPLYHGALGRAAAPLWPGADALGRSAGITYDALDTRVLELPSSLVARTLRLGAGHFTLDAACASAFYALYAARQLLLSGKADMMVAGALSAADPLFLALGFSSFQAYSVDGRSTPFEQTSTGLVPAEGAGVVVLKRLADAQRDGDRVLATILGIGLSNDGRGKGVLVPSARGQSLAYERAYRDAAVAPDTIDYIECHATGTAVGDRTELASLEAFFERFSRTPRIGSVKANLGHLLTASGMAGLTKVLLAMAHGQLPPTPGISQGLRSPRGLFGPDQLVSVLTDWPLPAHGGGRRAGLSAFGFGGSNAHIVLEQGIAARPRPRPQGSTRDALEIVGMAVHVGGCGDLSAFDRCSYEAQPLLRQLPPRRWKGLERDEQVRAALATRGQAPNGAYLTDFDFDFLKFRLPATADERLVPAQVLLLKVADAAVRDAGLARGANVAVIVGTAMDLEVHQHEARIRLAPALARSWCGAAPAQAERIADALKAAIYPPATFSRYTSFIGNLLASRVASHWDFTGPALTISAEENSVFRALEMAESLLGESRVEAVVVAGVDLAGSLENVLLNRPRGPVALQRAGSSFEAESGDWAVGEGAGAIVVCRASAREARAGSAWASIEGIGFRHGSEPEAIRAATRDAWRRASLRPREIAYLELSAAGIPQLDAAELEALCDVYRGEAPHICAIGSVKSLVGHTFAASGIMSLIRSALCVQHGYLPAAPNCNTPKTPSMLEGGPFHVPRRALPWLCDRGRRRVAAVSGVARDSSCHVILAAPEQRRLQSPACNSLLAQPLRLIPLRFHDRAQLAVELERIERALRAGGSVPALAHAQYTRYRAGGAEALAGALLAGSEQELLREIALAQSALAKAGEPTDIGTPGGSYFSFAPLGGARGVTFVYGGAFNAYPEAGLELWRFFPELFEHVQRRTAYAGTRYAETLSFGPALRRPDARAEGTRASHAPAEPVPIFEHGTFLAVLYTDLFRHIFGLRSESVFGFSMGEVAMLYAAGVWNGLDAMGERLRASPLFRSELAGMMSTLRRAWQLPVECVPDGELWRSFVLQVAPERAAAVVAGEPRVRLILVNSPSSVVIAGLPEACRRVIAALGCEAFDTGVRDVIHCDLVRHHYQAMAELHRQPVHAETETRFFTAVGYRELPVARVDLGRNIADLYCDTVDFARLTRTVYAAGARIFVELGPRDTCSRHIDETLAGMPHLVVPTDRKGIASLRAVLQALARLLSHRVPLNLDSLYREPPSAEGGPASLVLPFSVGDEPLQERLHAVAHAGADAMQPQSNTEDPMLRESTTSVSQSGMPQLQRSPRADRAAGVIWDQQDLEVFAEGKIADVFGPRFSPIDGYHRRVRLPAKEYLFVSRVTALDAVPGRFQPSRIVTEYDVPSGAWFVSHRQVPWAVACEAGQCDLLLISYLGIDFQNKGQRVYRLLDCTLTFVDRFPMGGDTLRYEIWIDSFARQGDALLFFFHYECFIGSKPVLRLDGGVAGFFSDAELAGAKGIVRSALDDKACRAVVPRRFEPPLSCSQQAFERKDLEALCRGELEACFGRDAGLGVSNPELALCTERMLMLDKIREVDPTGGTWGLGRVVAEKVLRPDDWYFPCHFRDDQVLAGSLMAEGCGQLLRFYLFYLGMHRTTAGARFQPLAGEAQRVRCRGQVTPQHVTLVYRMEITDIGLEPRPFVRANVEILIDGKVLAELRNLALCLDGEPAPPAGEDGDPRVAARPAAVRDAAVLPLHVPAVSLSWPGARVPAYVPGEYPVRRPPFRPFPGNPADRNCEPGTLPVTWYHLTEFATGNVVNCFGEDFARYAQRRTPRTPNCELQLVTRVLEIDGVRHDLKRKSHAIAEFDCPEDAWFFRDASDPSCAPHAVLMEIGMQPCGFLSAWLGASLMIPDADLCFRNLDGCGQLRARIDLRGKTIRTRADLLSTTRMGTTILQKFDFELACDGQVFFTGSAIFGYFERRALAQQQGLDKGALVAPWHLTPAGKAAGVERVPVREASQRGAFQDAAAPALRLARGRLNFIDFVDFAPAGGNAGLGYVHAERKIVGNEWFFACHFHHDPVMPGSLGIEAMIEALQVFALRQGLGKGLERARFRPALGECRWKYRGQITPRDRRMSLDVHISAVERHAGGVRVVGQGNLAKDGLRIYEVSALALDILEADD